MQRAGAYVCRVRTVRADERDGFAVRTALDLLLECAGDLGLVDLVALTDAACRIEELQPADLAAALPRGGRGTARLRAALALAEPRSESWYESVLRLVHVLSGITEIDAQAPIL